MAMMERLQRQIKYHEMDKKRWRVRYMILCAFGVILALKVYFTVFVIDPFVGIYTIITTSVTFGFFMFSYLRYKDPYYETSFLTSTINKPLVSIVIPVKNEEDFIRECVESCTDSTYSNKEIIIVDDGSTDRTGEILDEISREGKIRVIHNPSSYGKKRAVEIGTEAANGEFYVFMDSDCNMASDAVEKTMRIFMSDDKIGAITAHGRVRDADGNALLKMQDTWFDGNFRIVKGAESSFSTLSCCSGAYSAFRKLAIQPFIHPWVHDRFLGKEFKFATDRRLTAYLLGAKAVKNISGEPVKQSYYWKMKYSLSVKVFIGPPRDLRTLIKQQIRWRKSFIRSIFSTGGILWKRPFPIAMLLYLQMGLKILRPYVVIKSLFLLPLQAGDHFTPLFYFLSVIFVSMVYGLDFRLRNPGNTRWVYRPLMTMLGMFVFVWLLPYALITIRKTAWR